MWEYAIVYTGVIIGAMVIAENVRSYVRGRKKVAERLERIRRGQL